MPITGLPNPHLHRLCRKCRRWHDQDEGSMCAPTIAGPLSFLRNLRATAMDDETVQYFICFPCQKPKGMSPLVKIILAVAVAGLVAGLASYFHLIDYILPP